MNRKLRDDNRGAISYSIVFIVFTFSLILFFTFIGPLSQRINLESYKSAQGTVDGAIVSANTVTDYNVRTSLLSIYQAEKDSFVGQTQVVGTFIQYGWVFILVIVLFGLFLTIRKNVEAQGGVA